VLTSSETVLKADDNTRGTILNGFEGFEHSVDHCCGVLRVTVFFAILSHMAALSLFLSGGRPDTTRRFNPNRCPSPVQHCTFVSVGEQAGDERGAGDGRGVPRSPYWRPGV